MDCNWAIGHLAIGHLAIGISAIGHSAIGILAIGHSAIGILAIGHSAIGTLAIGHSAIGILAINVNRQSRRISAALFYCISHQTLNLFNIITLIFLLPNLSYIKKYHEDCQFLLKTTKN